MRIEGGGGFTPTSSGSPGMGPADSSAATIYRLVTKEGRAVVIGDLVTLSVFTEVQCINPCSCRLRVLLFEYVCFWTGALLPPLSDALRHAPPRRSHRRAIFFPVAAATLAIWNSWKAREE